MNANENRLEYRRYQLITRGRPSFPCDFPCSRLIAYWVYLLYFSRFLQSGKHSGRCIFLHSKITIFKCRVGVWLGTYMNYYARHAEKTGSLSRQTPVCIFFIVFSSISIHNTIFVHDYFTRIYELTPREAVIVTGVNMSWFFFFLTI